MTGHTSQQEDSRPGHRHRVKFAPSRQPGPDGRKRIVYIDHTATLGGGEIALVDLVANLDKSKYQPVVLLLSDGPLAKRLHEVGVETVILSSDRSLVETRKDAVQGRNILRAKGLTSGVLSVVQIARFLRLKHTDIVHTNSLKADFLGGIAARLVGIPVVFHIRDRIEPDYLPQLAVKVFRRFCRVVPTCIIGNSQATLRTLNLPNTIPASVVYSGVNLERIRMGSRRACAPQHVRIGLIGRISPWKGQHIFLRAAEKVRSHYPECRFQVIGSAMFGETDYEATLHTLVADLHLEDCIEFTGFRADIPHLLSELDILVHASVTGEPFGQTIVQGMAAGKPVVATNGGGVPEIITDGVTGLLVPMGDADAMATAIGRILADPAAAEKMGLAARRKVETTFTIEHTVRAVEAIYSQMLP